MQEATKPVPKAIAAGAIIAGGMFDTVDWRDRGKITRKSSLDKILTAFKTHVQGRDNKGAYKQLQEAVKQLDKALKLATSHVKSICQLSHEGWKKVDEEAKGMLKTLQATRTEAAILMHIKDSQSMAVADDEQSMRSTISGIQVEMGKLVGGLLCEEDILPAVAAEATRLLTL